MSLVESDKQWVRRCNVEYQNLNNQY